MEVDPGVSWSRSGVALEGDRDLDAIRILTPCVVPLADGSFRAFYMGHGPASPRGTIGRILSARSRDGIAWTKEDGVRIECEGDEERTLSPDVIAVDGGYRMYFEISIARRTSIASAFSRDGHTFVRDPGLRITRPGIAVGSPRALRLGDGRLRLYVHVYREPYTIALDRGNHVESAISSDGLAFEPEPGVRLAQTVPGVDDEAVYCARMCRVSPTVVRTYYSAWNGRSDDRGVIATALSSDGGWTFAKHSRACIDTSGPHDRRFASDPTVFRRADGRFGMLYEACDLDGKTRILAAISE